jgi:2-polyprenyl-3-methyl-5-hydroxy-6-metoxy-1,4-benzoquinol methylase
MLNQYGTADLQQLTSLLELLRLRPGSHVLDAGCGTGHTTRYLAEKSQARFIGIDTAEPAIRRAQELAAPVSESLAFKVATMDALDFSLGSFDAVIAIESLYFCKDLASTIAQFQKILRSHGQMALFFTHIAGAAGESLAAADTRLGAALRANNIAFDVYDFSESDRSFWKRSKEIAEELRADFEIEGNADLMHLNETDAVLDLIQKGRHARYLYRARVR